MLLDKKFAEIRKEIDKLRNDSSLKFLTMAKCVGELQIKVNLLENPKTPEKPKTSAKPKRKTTKS